MQPSSNKVSEETIKAFQDVLFNTEGFKGDFRFDQTTRILYSTDASIYQIEPIGVAIPRFIEDLNAIISAVNTIGIPITPRGSGSSLAGQAIGPSIIVDCSRHLNKIIHINPETNEALVQPGVILDGLNKAAAQFKLQFGPDPASAERATVGGSIANNASGAHSIIYGMTGDHVMELDVVLADGTTTKFSEVQIGDFDPEQEENPILRNLIRTVHDLRKNYREDILTSWPYTWRRVSGYSLNYLLPWSPSQPPLWNKRQLNDDRNTGLPYPPVRPEMINLAPLMAGSEGTLGVIQQARLRLVPRPRNTILAVLAYPGIAEACDAVPALLEKNPDAIELIPQSLIRLARALPAYSRQLSFVSQLTPDGSDPAAILVVEFSGEDKVALKQQALALDPHVYLAESVIAQKQVWDVRKVGLGILQSIPGNIKPIAFIEDIAVPVQNLGEFVRQLDYILQSFGTRADYYAHASAGCLHIRPLLDLKTEVGVKNLRAIAEQAVALTLKLQGAVSAEHGDGLARSEWLERSYGSRIMEAFRKLKTSADPKGLMNPGKIIDPAPMDTQLRFGSEYHSKAWKPVFSFSTDPDQQGEMGLINAIEQCNGAGVCRKSNGVMCPSFQASQEELHGTRGRANILRAMITGHFSDQTVAEKTVKEALDLCLACKGCKSECPSGVDIAKLKYEFTQYYYEKPGIHRPWRDYLFGHFDRISRFGYPFRRLVNPLFKTNWFKKIGNPLMAVAPERSIPSFSEKSLTVLIKTRRIIEKNHGQSTILLLNDAFTEYFHADVGLATVKLLETAGFNVVLLPVLGAGRTLISKGFLKLAKDHAIQLIESIRQVDPEGNYPLIGIEPSEIYTLRDEYLDFFPENTYVKHLSTRAWMIDEFLLRLDKDSHNKFLSHFNGSKAKVKKILYHGHCYQKSQPPAPDGMPVGVSATVNLLESVGYSVEVIDSSCCGMAGAFGYEKEHYAFSQQVAEINLYPAIRKGFQSDPDCFIAASGVSCQVQIQDGLQCKPYHPAQLVYLALENT